MAWAEHSRGRKRRKLLRLAGIVLLVVVVLGAFYGLSLLGPRKVQPKNVYRLQDASPEQLRLLDESGRLENEFRQAVVVRDPTDEDVSKLRRALELLEEFVKKSGVSNYTLTKRQEVIRTDLQTLDSLPLVEEVRQLQERANRHMDLQDYEEAHALYQEALEKQASLAKQYPLSRKNDVSVGTRLQRQTMEALARPVYDKSVKMEKLAEDAVARESWLEARERLGEAIAYQEQVNDQYPGTRSASMLRLQKLRDEVASYESIDSFLEIDQQIQEARELEEAGQALAAADLYKTAMRAQRDLNVNFPRSRFASADRVEELLAASERAISRDVAQSLLDGMKLVDEALLQGEYLSASEKIGVLLPKIESFRRNYPRSELISDESLLKLQYLSINAERLSRIAVEIRERVLPVPGGKVSMSSTEVPQSLYTLVMGSNPSRHQGDDLPVDSVTWTEANTFCQRVGWVLGERVALPSIKEIAAVLDVERELSRKKDSFWHAENGAGKTHPVSSANSLAGGFYHLLGNVEEWLRRDSGQMIGDATVAGGSVQDIWEDLVTVPIKPAGPNQRNRFTGFRYVIFSGE